MSLECLKTQIRGMFNHSLGGLGIFYPDIYSCGKSEGNNRRARITAFKTHNIQGHGLDITKVMNLNSETNAVLFPLLNNRGNGNPSTRDTIKKW